MRYLLMLGAALSLVLAVSAIDEKSPKPAAAHSGHPVLAVLFHPASNLACGWHYNCDGVFGDNPSMGLDWQPCQGCTRDVYLRLRIVLGSGLEALGQAYNSPYLGCPKARITDVKRLADSAVFGQIINLHTQSVSSQVVNFHVGDNTASIGTMVPLGQDPCATFVHTMQWYVSGLYDTDWSQNVNGWPSEANCNQSSNPPCNTGYLPWNTREYNFTFTS
jgi:hypothetical protein